MTISTKRPPIKETVGAQYICFCKKTDSGEFKGIYEEEVEKTEVVKSVSVTENSETTPIIASGKNYMSVTDTSSTDVSVEVIAFCAETRAKMRSDTITESGLILKGSSKGQRPYFAYGKVVHLSNNFRRWEWFPKCQLTSNSDETKTKEDKFSEQNDTLTISAMPFDDDGNICVSVETDYKLPEGLTEAAFFAKPILSEADLPKNDTVNPAKEKAGDE